MEYFLGREFAISSDENDALSGFRDRFFIPKEADQDLIYLAGNSLGLEPISTATYVQQELDQWKKFAVEGHFTGQNPWLGYHKQFRSPLALLTGGLESEVVCMNSLTVNVHLMLTSFFEPDGSKRKVLLEKDLFPSDLYAIKSQLRQKGLSEDDLIFISSNEAYISNDDILDLIEAHQNELALVYLSSTNYLTGQVYDIQRIAQLANARNITIGLDLAHGIGNIPLQLHDWGIDFATWCSYKYLNSGPGGVGGAFVHERHHQNQDITRLEGWWGTEEKERFQMKAEFESAGNADAWQLSNAPVMSMACHKAALDIFEEAEPNQVFQKGKALSGYLRFLLNDLKKEGRGITILTPEPSSERGCQISFVITSDETHFHTTLRQKGIVIDARNYKGQKLFRAAPTPLYNSFEDVYRFYLCLKEIL